MVVESTGSVLFSLKMQKPPHKKFKRHSMTAMMNLLLMLDRLPSGFTARLAIAKYIPIGNNKQLFVNWFADTLCTRKTEPLKSDTLSFVVCSYKTKHYH